MSPLIVTLNTTLAVLNCQKCPYFSPVLLRRSGPQWAHDLYFRINETLCCVGMPGALFSEKYLLAWSYDALTSFDNKHICWLHAWGREIPKGHLCFLHPPTPSHPPLPRGRTFLSSHQKVKARLLNIVLAKNTRVKMPHQCFFHHSPWWRTIAFVGDSRAVQFPVSAFDKDREVEGCVAEASIRSRGLKTEAAAGDIPGWKA